MAVPAHSLPAPFDAVADRYDETFTESIIGRAQRGAIWKELVGAFQSGQRVLEIGCGTGVDACFLAERGISVIACDSSSRMVEITKQRVLENNYEHWIEPRLLPAEGISQLRSQAPFDGAFSNFGALNCVEDLSALAIDLVNLLKPGATALFCFINRVCAWEIVWYSARGNLNKALRRIGRGGVIAQISNGPPVHVHYPSVRSLARAFEPDFQLQSVEGIGVLVPPSYLEPWASRHLAAISFAEQTDLVLSRVPGVRLFADHILVKFKRRQ